MARTTISLDHELLEAARSRARSSGTTVSGLVADALRRVLTESPSPPAPAPELPVFTGDGVLPGVDLDDSAALAEVMDAAAPDR